MTLERFKNGATPEGLKKLNAVVDHGNRIGEPRGDEFIQVQLGPTGSHFSLNLPAVLKRVPKPYHPKAVFCKVTTAGASGVAHVTECDDTGTTTGGVEHADVEVYDNLAVAVGTLGVLVKDKGGLDLFVPVFRGTRWGKPTSAFSSGTTMTLDPCDIHGTDNGEGNKTVYVQASQASYTMQNSTTVATSTIVPFAMGDDGYYYVMGMPKVVMTAFQVVTASQLLQAKYRDDWGAFCGTESGWITVHTGDVCA